MAFHVGQRVVCIDDSKPEKFNPMHYPNWVKKDEEYHIREVLSNDDIVTGILLVELKNPLIPIPLVMKFQEGAFATWRFREEKSAFEIREEKANKIIESFQYVNDKFSVWDKSVTRVL